MRGFAILGFLLALPAFAAIGHDIYLAYNNTNMEGVDRFYFSALGWILTEYSPETYDFLYDGSDEETWNNFIDPLLKQKAVVVGAAPFAIFALIVGSMRILGLGPYEGQGLKITGSKKRKKGKYSFSSEEAHKKVKYKRK